MQYLDLMQQSLDDIEQNLKTDITAVELSRAANFSLYHYYRLFQDAVGLPVKQYIIRRRLLWAIYEISCGQKLIDTALCYGFDTAAGFYKAFVKEFGCSPSAYRKRYPVNKPYRIDLQKEVRMMISKERVKNILTHWGLEKESFCHMVYEGSGAVNENVFRVGERYFLKAYVNIGTLRKNTAIAELLWQAGFSAPIPMKTLDGKDYVTDGELTFALTPRAEGMPLSARSLYENPCTETCRSIGEGIGRLHEALKERENVVCHEENIFDEVRKDWLAPAKAAMGLSEEFCSEYQTAAEKFSHTLPEQLIHRDPNPSNLLMQDGKLIGFLDFDMSQRSMRIYDPCYACTGILVESFAKENEEKRLEWCDIFRNVLHGYDSVVHLTEMEKQAVPYVVLSIQLICVGYFSGEEKFQAQAESNIRMTRWLLEHWNQWTFDFEG